MIYEGTVRRGVVVLPPDVRFPDGHVSVVPIHGLSAQQSVNDWQGTLRNGVPVFARVECAEIPDLDLVNRLRDETP